MPSGLRYELCRIRKFPAAACDEALLEIDISNARYEGEFLMLSSAAALHAIETAGLVPMEKNAAAAGFYDWLRELPKPTRKFLLETLRTQWIPMLRRPSQTLK
jgi:hypothetical protein